MWPVGKRERVHRAGISASRPSSRIPSAAGEGERYGQECKKCGARDSGADGQFAPACPAFLLHWKHAGQGVQAGGGEMLLVAVVVVPAETGGDLPERAGVLTALMAVDEFAQARVADADDEHLANRRRQG